ncbi:MAG: helix-turn-helix transcriptional regulator [Fluviicola sp.]
MNINTLLPNLSVVDKIPWLFVSLSISFGIHGLLKTFEVNRGDFSRLTNLGVPMLLTITIIILILSRTGNSRANWNTFWLILLVFITLVFASFTLYLEEQLHFVSYLYVNFIFLLFSAIQYWQIKSSKLVIRDSTITLPEENGNKTTNQANELSQYGLTKTEKEIIEELLEGATYNEIAEKRVRSYSAISSQASNAFSKLGVHSQDELLEKFKTRK